MLRYYSSSELAAFLDKNQILSSTKGQVVSEQSPTLRIFAFGAVLTLFCAATKPIPKAVDRGKHVSVGLPTLLTGGH